jgi:hypothetical protein
MPPPNFDFPNIISVGLVLSLRSAQPDIFGSNFGTTPGRALLFGSFGQYELHIDSWSDTQVDVDWGSLTGVKDQQAQWQIIRADGVASAKFTAQFTANRAEAFLPQSLVRIRQCSPNGSELNTCVLPTSDTIQAYHLDNTNVGAVGYDYYLLPPLANGWTYETYQFSKSQGVVYQEEYSADLVGWAGGSSSQYVDVEWQTFGGQEFAQYDLLVTIMGPVGLPYQ